MNLGYHISLTLFPSMEIRFEILDKILNEDNLKIKLKTLVEKNWLSEHDECYKLDKNIQALVLRN